MSSFLIAVGAPRLVLWAQLVWLAALTPAMLFGIDRWGIAGAGWAHLIVAVVVVLPLSLVLIRRYATGLTTVLRYLAVPSLAAVPAATAGILVADRIDNLFLALLVGGTITTVVFLAPLARWLTRRLADLRRTTAAPAPEPAAPVLAVAVP